MSEEHVTPGAALGAEEIAGLLAEHEFWNCVFNDCIGEDATEADHRAHLVDILADRIDRG